MSSSRAFNYDPRDSITSSNNSKHIVMNSSINTSGLVRRTAAVRCVPCACTSRVDWFTACAGCSRSCRQSRQLSRVVHRQGTTGEEGGGVGGAAGALTAAAAGEGGKTGRLVRLFGAEYAVAGIAETGQDVALLVDPLVNVAHVDVDAWVLSLNGTDTLGRGEETHQ
jgi:hypothetical protein